MPQENKHSVGSSVMLVRAVVAFLLLALLLGLLHWWGYDSYRDVAEWAEPGNHEVLLYNGEAYRRVGRIGKSGLTKSKYPLDEIIGQVKDDGVPVTTEAATTAEPDEDEYLPIDDPELWEETETLPESVEPPAGASLFSDKRHTYVLYSVEKKPDHLLLLLEDGGYDLYERAAAPDTET